MNYQEAISYLEGLKIFWHPARTQPHYQAFGTPR